LKGTQQGSDRDRLACVQNPVQIAICQRIGSTVAFIGYGVQVAISTESRRDIDGIGLAIIITICTWITLRFERTWTDENGEGQYGPEDYTHGNSSHSLSGR